MAPPTTRRRPPAGRTVQPSPTKRRRTATPGRQATPHDAGDIIPVQKPRERGKLKQIPEMPIDILFEVFSHLDALDIMRLSRTTKALRRLLMHRSAISIWKAALSRDTLPPLPVDLNEPQYVNLAFSEHCHNCLASGKHIILWTFRTRLCPNCLTKDFVYSNVLGQFGPSIPLQHLRISPDILRNDRTDFTYILNREEVRALAGDPELAEAPLGFLAPLGAGFGQVHEVVQQRIDSNEPTRQFAEQCRKAEALRAERIRLAEEAARAERTQKIFERLYDLGYKDEVAYLEDDGKILSNHTLLRTHKELTERSWGAMLPTLLNLLEDARGKVLKKKRKTIYKTRLNIVSNLVKAHAAENPDKITPSAADICVIPKIKAILENNDVEIYEKEEDFSDLKAELPKISREWRRSKGMYSLSLMPGNKHDISRLSLATTFFKCHQCTEPISYPRVLAHKCMTALRHGYRNRSDDLVLLCKGLQAEPWNFDRNGVECYELAGGCAVDVVRASGLRAEKATVEDMERADVWLECMNCRAPERGSVVFQWRQAILHGLQHAERDTVAVWRALVNDRDIYAARNEEIIKTKAHTYGSDDYTCRRCDEKVNRSRMRSHCQERHGITNPTKDDFTLDVDASMSQQPFPILIPLVGSAEPEVIDLLDPDPIVISDSEDVEPECIEIMDDDDEPQEAGKSSVGTELCDKGEEPTLIIDDG
ncbi:uncharacterized protein EV420DRAFT_1519856 [Desarmillaria tabescens]|uniref:F-box domain-containing protein n=1 Tax=Armillaria tabescens TaxID=1929756 RepID=A0AA39TZC1_ARMTA|nr:uncharacterized protein EV420DRAFT_1519856 [Desarmillaria tabescens]KAK0463740.1 hypothetical protein EV420DRAFT_1519856 [Desarmillaria tabescens]